VAKSRPMGYIFPKRIQEAIAGESSNKTYYGGGLTKEEKKKFAEEKLKQNKEKSEKQKALEDARSPWTCPACEKMMRKKLDQKYFNRRGMCMDCTIKAETYLRTHGLFEKYEEAVSLRNYKAYMIDVKEQAVEFVNNLKSETKIVNHDGTFDTLTSDITEVKEFMLHEIEDIDKKLEEVKDIDMSLSAEYVIGVNLKEIVKDILKEEKEREQLVEDNS